MIKNLDGINLTVRLTPKADRDAVYGCETTENGLLIKARVRAVPEKGKANIALIKLIAKWLGTAKSNVTLLKGDTSRQKQLFVYGDSEELQSHIDLLIQEFN